MSAGQRIKGVLAELKHHSPFTAFGALVGILFVFLFKDVSEKTAETLFMVFHPGHVVLSAMVTAALFRKYHPKTNILIIIIVGWVGSIGIATLSDSVIPFFGESILGVSVPAHAAVHHHSNEAGAGEHQHDHDHGHSSDMPEQGHVHDETCEHHQHEHKLHIGFIEHWYIVNPAAFLGIIIAWFIPSTKFPHGIHVLISTWASSSHILMNTGSQFSAVNYLGIFIVLFIAVWLPCCVSDIVFPMLLTGGRAEHEHHRHKDQNDSEK